MPLPKELFMHTYESVVLFLTSLILVRVVGKRTLAQLSPFDFIFLIILGAAIAVPLEDSRIKLTNGIIPIIIVSALNYLLSVIITKNRALENFLQGPSRVLVRDGEVLVKNLKKERITMADLLVLLREKNVWNINEVKEATIEPNGKLSVIKKKHLQNVTPKDLGLVNSEGIFPTIIIDNGNVVADNLEKASIGIDQLLKQINKKGVTDLKQITSAWIDEEGNITTK